MKNYINWKTFFILLGLSQISVICVFPYVLTVQAELFEKIEVPLGLVFFIQLIQSAILFSIAIFLGLFFTRRINFKLPLIEAILEKGDYRKVLKDILAKSILWGIAAALVIYSLDYLFTLQGAGISTHQNYAPAWQTLLASFYGGITEEVLMRLFLMTFFIWAGMKLFKQKESPSKMVVIVSIFLAAIIFGLGHLPITASLTTITPLVISRAVVLNGVGGIIFGWLFWRKGLESAMIAHFATDIFLLTLLPLV